MKALSSWFQFSQSALTPFWTGPFNFWWQSNQL